MSSAKRKNQNRKTIRRRRFRRRMARTTAAAVLLLAATILIWKLPEKKEAGSSPPAAILQKGGEIDRTVSAQDSARDGWNLVLINPWNALPDDFEVPSLTKIYGNYQVDSRCADALREMLAACEAEGLSPIICSAWRSGEKQRSLYEEQVQKLLSEGYDEDEARDKAATSVARPGTSEHELGLAVDLVDKSYQMLNHGQEQTAVQQWLMENSWRYGFILRYPTEKSNLTGIIYEPWHYRYVGYDAAKEIYERGICLEEYLE